MKLGAFVAVLLLVGGPARGQVVIEDRQVVGFEQPEGWAMAWVTASTVMTGFGETPLLGAGEWRLGAVVGQVPHLDAGQRQVGLGGSKQEDLNKSPVFGRVRGWLGLPAGFVAELGWTPPLEVDGVQPRGLVAAALGRRLLDGNRWSWSARLLGQHGRARGDITCAAELVSATAEDNPFGCLAPSNDRIRLNYYGLDSTVAFALADSDWRGHATLGLVRTEPRVHVDATLTSHVDRTRLVTSGQMPYVALGLVQGGQRRWSWAGELLYVPLQVVRGTDGTAHTDAFWSLRLSLRFGS